MQPFKHSFITIALLLLAVATYVVLAGGEPASPATTGEGTSESCLSQAHECVTATFLGYTHHTDGTTTLSYRITNNCAETVETVAIETGHWTRLTPTDGGSYSGTLGDYTTQWIGPVADILTQGIRFDNSAPDYRNGASDDFTITVRDFVAESPNTIRVVTKQSGINNYSFRWMLLDPTCENGVDPTPRPMPTSTPTVTPTHTPTPVPTATQPFSPLPTPTPTPETGVTLPTSPVVAECVFGPPEGGLPPEEAIIPLDAYSFSEPQLVLTNTAPIGIHQWLPDSETLLVTRHTGHGNQLELFNIQTRTVTQLIAPDRAIDAPRWLATDRSVFWRELSSLDNDPGYWVRSFDPPGERRLSDNGTGAGVPYAVSPDGTQVLLLALPSGTQPFLWNQVTKTLRALPVDLAAWRYQRSGTPYPFQPFNVAWQPGSDKLLFWDGTWLFLYDLASNRGCEIRTRAFVTTTFIFVQAATWSPNGRYLLLKNTEYPLYTMTSGPHDLVLVLDTYTGEAIQYALGNSVYSFFWTPDNQTVAVVKKTERQIQMADGGVAYRTGMFLFNIHNGMQQQILPIYSATSEDGLAWSPDGAWLAFLGSSLDTNGKRGSGGVQVSRVTKLP